MTDNVFENGFLCRRCRGFHLDEDLEFHEFDYPVRSPGNPTFEYWYRCPETDEPGLVIDKDGSMRAQKLDGDKYPDLRIKIASLEDLLIASGTFSVSIEIDGAHTYLSCKHPDIELEWEDNNSKGVSNQGTLLREFLEFHDICPS